MTEKKSEKSSKNPISKVDILKGSKKGNEKQAQAQEDKEIFFDKEASYAASKFNVNPETGLTDDEAKKRLEQYGPNQLDGGGGVKWWKVLFTNFFNPMNGVLMFAIVLSAIGGDPTEVVVLSVIIITNTGLGFKQEYSSEKTMDALRKMASPTARVMRNGEVKTVQSTTVVPGDILYVEDGDQVSADCRFIEVVNLAVDEALLTGESLPVKKSTGVIMGDPFSTQVGDRTNMGFKQTTVARGRGHAVVTATGLDTEIGAIAKSVMEGSVQTKTPLEKAMFWLMMWLLVVALLFVLLIFGLANFDLSDNSVLLYGIAVAVALLPEGLPTVVTVTMSFGVRRIAQQKAVIRRLVSLENLGSVTNVCSDKTGTLTEGKMAAVRAWVGHEWFNITGSVDPNDKDGIVERLDKDKNKTTVTRENLSNYPMFDQVLTVCGLCHSSSLAHNSEGKWVATGDPTELALVVLGVRFDKTKQSLEGTYKFLAEAPFDSSIKRMSVVREEADGSLAIFAKGAVEGILSRATGYADADGTVHQGISEEYREIVNKNMTKMAKKGLRVLAFGVRRIPPGKMDDEERAQVVSGDDRNLIEKELIFIGLVGLQDPPRVQSAPAVRICQEAGIVVHMATGDHPLTARTIAKQVGILRPPIKEHLVMVAAEFDRMTDEQVDAMELPLVLARCSPQSKVKLVRALHRRKKRVAMTGDGVNDAPAVKNADVGIAMGQGGSDVTRQASDMTLTDDNFATITAAVSEGRRIFSNIVKFTLHLLSGNVSEVVSMVVGLAIRDSQGSFIFPMSPIQILYLNLLTSSPVAMALGVELAGKEIMKQYPRNHGVFHFELILDTFFYGLVLGVIALVSYILHVILVSQEEFTNFTSCNSEISDECYPIFVARGTAFYFLSLALLVHGFVCRHTRRSLLKNKMTWDGSKWLVFAVLLATVLIVPTAYIPFLNTNVFKQAPIDGFGWLFTVVGIIIFLIITEIYKFVKRHTMKSLYNVPIVEGIDDEHDSDSD